MNESYLIVNETSPVNPCTLQAEGLFAVGTVGYFAHPVPVSKSTISSIDLWAWQITAKDRRDRLPSIAITASTLMVSKEGLLELAYQRVLSNQNDVASFVQQIENIDWDAQSPQTFKKAIEMAISLECVAIARQLADRGYKRNPTDDALKKLADVLTPPKIIERCRPTKGLSAFMEWFGRHTEEYRGLWVAMLGGNFLGAASSEETLIGQLGDVSTDPDLIISLMP